MFLAAVDPTGIDLTPTLPSGSTQLVPPSSRPHRRINSALLRISITDAHRGASTHPLPKGLKLLSLLIVRMKEGCRVDYTAGCIHDIRSFKHKKHTHTHTGRHYSLQPLFSTLKRTLIVYSEGTCKQIQYENLAEHHQET